MRILRFVLDPGSASSSETAGGLVVLLLLLLGAVACSGSSVVGADDARSGEGFRFRDPTGNVACVMDVEAVQCDVAMRDWSPGTAPDDCILDWGNGVVLDASGAEPTCASDSLLGEGGVLDAGATRRSGPFSCEVLDDGVRCEAESGAGFRLARSTWELW